MPVDLAKLLKRCGTCAQFKPLDEFYHVNKERGYRQSYCKDCMKRRAIEAKSGHNEKFFSKSS